MSIMDKRVPKEKARALIREYIRKSGEDAKWSYIPPEIKIPYAKDNVFLKRISISRRFLSRLSSARKHMMKYYSAPSGAELASCIKSLEDLSFETLALQLEEKELRKHPEFKNSFEKNFK